MAERTAKLNPGTDAVDILDAAQKTARAEAKRQAARAEQRRRRAFAAGLVAAVCVALVSLGVALLVALPALNRQTEDVARVVSSQVGERVVGDARQQRILTGRRELAEANSRLTARGLPLVPDPGPQASGDELLIQAARANVIADLPEEQVAGLRDLPGNPDTLPSALGDPRENSTGRDLGDRVVTLLPIVPGQGPVDEPRRGGGTDSSRDRPAPGRSPSNGTDGPSRADTPAPANPAPPPATRRPGLLEPCVLGRILC